jgi:putative NADH-flavin reductase
MTKILIFGGTGRTGIYVVRSTVTNNDEVILFVRSPDKVESDVRDKVQIIQGDFLDLAAIKNCVQTTQPDAIIFTTSVVRYGRIQSLNATTVPAIVDELKSEGRLGSVRLIYLSGAATLAKGESLGILGYFSPLIGYLIGASGSIADNNETVKYLESYLEKDSEINFTVVRMVCR